MSDSLVVAFGLDRSVDAGGWIMESPDRLLRQLPEEPGAFAIVASNPIERLRGSSPVLYLGRTKGLQTRFRGLVGERNRSTIDERTGDRLAFVLADGLYSEVGAVSVRWRVTSTHPGAHSLWRDLMYAYDDAHLELPPLNRSAPKSG